MGQYTDRSQSQSRVIDAVRANFETFGYATVDLNGDGPGFTTGCPACSGLLRVDIDDDDGTRYDCPGNCDQAQILAARLRSVPDAAQLLERVMAFMGRFVLLPSTATRRALALFVLHTWVFDSAYATPYIVVESPEKQSGKTRLLEVLELLCRAPKRAANVSPAALYQTIEGHQPTLLIDEADAIFGRSGERNEELRGVLNAGNMPGSPVSRGGKDGEPVEYDVYCPKVIAGIATGSLPDTIRDRAIVIAIDRKKRSERVERLRKRKVETEVGALRGALVVWADAAHGELSAYELGESLEKISDRLEEAWEPLLAIAAHAGGVWPEETRRAAEVLAAGEADADADDSHLLLVAMKDVFGDEDVLATSAIQTILNANEELPFGAYNDGKGIKPTQIAKLLKRYRVKPKSVRIGDKTPRGYRREWLSDAWERYLPATPASAQPWALETAFYGPMGRARDSEFTQEWESESKERAMRSASPGYERGLGMKGVLDRCCPGSTLRSLVFACTEVIEPSYPPLQ